jgi:hypothetical protein
LLSRKLIPTTVETQHKVKKLINPSIIFSSSYQTNFYRYSIKVDQTTTLQSPSIYPNLNIHSLHLVVVVVIAIL